MRSGAFLRHGRVSIAVLRSVRHRASYGLRAGLRDRERDGGSETASPVPPDTGLALIGVRPL